MAKRVRIEFEGPFFKKDPRKTFRQNVRDFMDEVAELGEAQVQAEMRRGQASRQPMRGVEPDRVSGHVRGRTKSLKGRRWAVTAVVSVRPDGLTARQAKTLMAAASRIESREHTFRRVASAIRAARTDLLKGLR